MLVVAHIGTYPLARRVLLETYGQGMWGGGNLSTHTIMPYIVGCEPLSFFFQGGDVAWLL
nr:MAG TPA: hypothetical protein [Caudoviricetes sp.]